MKTVQFHLVVFHTLFLGRRGSEITFDMLKNKLDYLRTYNANKVVLPQDEFIHSEQLCKFINEFDVSHVFSCSPETEWAKIYSMVNREKVKIFQVLTGYLDDKTVGRIDRMAARISERTIDVGYRTQRLGPSGGRHGQIKSDIADAFEEKSHSKQLITDISTKNKDIFMDDEWFRFLLKCKYTIGVEGGTSVHDPAGMIKQKAEKYLFQHPDASFAEVEAACFPGLDGSLNLFAISPRHLEACATKTCQVLVEGYYNGILSPGEHYIELKKDFSNLDQVLDTLKNDQHRERITKHAYRDIVLSRKYTYRAFVDSVLDGCLSHSVASESLFHPSYWNRFVNRWAWLDERLSRGVVYLVSLPRHRLRQCLPEKDFDRLANWVRKVRR